MDILDVCLVFYSFWKWINGAMNFSSHLLGTLKHILFALQTGFVFPSHGLGGEHLLAWTICLWTQAREEWGKEKLEKNQGGMRTEGPGRERWIKTVMDVQRLTGMQGGKSWKRVMEKFLRL